MLAAQVLVHSTVSVLFAFERYHTIQNINHQRQQHHLASYVRRGETISPMLIYSC
jgi:hypothetical protein